MPIEDGREVPAEAITDDEVAEWYNEEESQEDEAPPPVPDKAIEQKYADSQIQIVRSTIDFTLHTLKQSLKDPNYINISPTYQRRTRWDRKRRSLLIESFLMNIPVPPIFLFENQYNQYETMDGRQRLETIRDFLESGFALVGLEYFTELNGRRFDDLNPTLQRGLLRRSITAIVLLAETTRPDASPHDVRMILFRRLNTGGARLNPQEMRNALYPGHFNKKLATIARSVPFTQIWGIPGRTPDEDERVPKELMKNALYRNMADCELVLRFFAIRETIENELKGSIRHLLDKCMERHSSDVEATVNLHEAQYQQCLNTMFQTFDLRPFILPTTNRPSRPLYDALMVALSLQANYDPLPIKEQIQKRLVEALENTRTYDILIGRGNTIEAIRDRVALAHRILRG